jgi:DNA-binding NarL/FixJ family response regulator
LEGRVKEHLIDGLAGMAMVAVGAGAAEDAARLLGAAAAQREALGYVFEIPERERYGRAVAAVRAVLGDDAFAAAEATGRLLSLDEAVAEAKAVALAVQAGRAAPPAPGNPGLAAAVGLTRREAEVLRLLVDGRSDRAIAAALFISPKTAGNHVSAILAKLGGEGRAGAAALAVRHGLA